MPPGSAESTAEFYSSSTVSAILSRLLAIVLMKDATFSRRLVLGT
jgi:hypothetical protein